MFSPFRTIILFIACSLVGWAFVPSLPVDLKPLPIANSLTISYQLPDAPPDIVEQQLTAPIENAFSQLTEIKKIRSLSNQSRGYVEIDFDADADMDFKHFEAQALLRQLYPSLPPHTPYPQIQRQKQDTESRPLLIYSIHAPLLPHQIYERAKELLVLPIAQIEGIHRAELVGANPTRLLISLDEEKMQRYQISREEIAQTMQQYAKNENLGQLHIGNQRVFASVGATLAVASLADVPLETGAEGEATRNARTGGWLKLGDIAEIVLEEQPATSHYRVNGKNAIRLLLTATENSNRLKLAAQVKEEMAALEGRLPDGFQVVKDYDDTTYIEEELDKIYYRTGLSIGILLLLVLLINRNIRYLAILFSGLVVNVSITLLLAKMMNLSIHLYSLAGLAVSFGLILDNAIVMLDSLHRHKNQKVFIALLAASATTVAALLLVFLLPQEERMSLTEFAAIVAVNLGVSLAVAKFYTPAAYALWYKQGEKASRQAQSVPQWFSHLYGGLIGGIARWRKSFYLLLVFAFGTPIFMLPASIEGWDWYNQTIGSDWYQKEWRLPVDKALGGSLRMFVRNVFEKSGYRAPERTLLYVNAEMKSGHTLAQMDEVMQKVEQYLSSVEGIDQFVTNVYSGQFAQVVISFLPEYENGLLPHQLKGRFIARAVDWSGVAWDVYGFGQGFSNDSREQLASFRVEMRGFNYGELEEQAEVLAQKLLAHKRIHEVNTNERLKYSEKGLKEYVLKFNEGQLQYSPAMVRQAINARAEQRYPQTYWPIGSQWQPAFLETAGAGDFSIYDLKERSVFLADEIIQLKHITKASLQTRPSALHKEDRQYIRVVGFDYTGSGYFGEQYLTKVLEEIALEMPLGYTAKQLKFNWSFDKVKRQYSLLAILIVAIYFICAILFESLLWPLMIIAVIPLSFIGLFLTFSELEFYFDQGGYAAFILLGGLSVNAAIFLLHEYGQLEGQGNKRVLQAVWNKAWPIFLTILSTIFGLVPFLMEGQQEVFWFSLAVGTIGGLVGSLLGIFVLLPVVLWQKVPKG